MSDDRRTEQLIADLSALLNEIQRDARPIQETIVKLRKVSTAIPWTLRFINMPLNKAVLQYLAQEAPNGATKEEIRDALISGGARYNMPNFDRDFENSLGASVRSDSLLKQGDKYFPGSKPPSSLTNRHKKK
jgi:hypothetical protein